MLKKNELKNLIYIQENEQCNEQTIKGLFRSIVEPILESSTESVVMLRLEDKSRKDFDSIVKRLGFSAAKVYDYSDIQISEKFENVLKEKIWNKTEFVYVLSERFGAVLIFDYEESELENFASFYIMHNSKNLNEAFDVINANSNVDLKDYETKWRPDRRENELLNSSIRKLVANLNETNQEIMISEMEKEQIVKSDDANAKLEFISTKSSYVAHEMKNLLSVCNLYSDIIMKQSDKIKYDNEDIKKSVENANSCISKTLEMATNMLLDFKSLNKLDLRDYDLKNLIETALDLSKVYLKANQKLIVKNMPEVKILADKNKFLAVIINLIKNAAESMENIGEINISAKITDENVKIRISNTGKSIPKEIQSKIFDEGFTTKKEGQGLGLKICKKTLEEQYAKLELLKSDEKSTDFEIAVLRG